MAIKTVPDKKWLRQHLDYDPLSGRLSWKHRPREMFSSERNYAVWNARYAGREAGSHERRSGRVVVASRKALLDDRAIVGSHLFRAHRLIWKWMTGAEPPEIIDHINGHPGDNRWRNLRAATVSMNNRNRRGKVAKLLLLPKGVYRSKKSSGWWARVQLDKVPIYLGTFDTHEEARAAYLGAVSVCEHVVSGGRKGRSLR